MVSTDLFGRGIDIERVNIVINYAAWTQLKASCVPFTKDMPDESALNRC